MRFVLCIHTFDLSSQRYLDYDNSGTNRYSPSVQTRRLTLIVNVWRITLTHLGNLWLNGFAATADKLSIQRQVAGTLLRVVIHFFLLPVAPSDLFLVTYMCQQIAYQAQNSDVILGYVGWAAGNFQPGSYVLVNYSNLLVTLADSWFF